MIRKFSFIYTLFFSLSLVGASPKTVVIIGEVVKEFDDQTPCDFQYWASKLENSCKCCLIKRAPDVIANKKTVQAVIDECITKEKQCDLTVIETLLNQEKISSRDRQQALKKLITLLYDHSVIVKDAKSGTSTFDPQGNFKESAIPAFLEQAFKDGVLTNPDFKSASCITAKDIMSEKGYQTKQLFEVSSTCSGKKKEYVLKEIASGTAEILRLTQSVLVPELDSYINPKYVAGYPLFIMPTAYISYRYNDKDHYLALMPKSEGIKASSAIALYKQKQISLQEVEKMFYEIGRALSLFHKKFMEKYKDKAQPNILLNQTMVQGDAHQANIFYDPITNTVILIDNERIADYSPRSPLWEIQYFFFTTLSLFTSASIKTDKPFMKEWIYLTMKNFMLGYISAYYKEQRTQLVNELYNGMKTDTRSTPYKDVVDRVFNELQKVAAEKPMPTVKPRFAYQNNNGFQEDLLYRRFSI